MKTDITYHKKKERLRCMKIGYHGSAPNYREPKFRPRIIFSGSLNKPKASMHIVIWRLDIWFWPTPKPIAYIVSKIDEWKLDQTLKADGIRCPQCGSYKLRSCQGMAGEPMTYCKTCGEIIWSADPEPYIR